MTRSNTVSLLRGITYAGVYGGLLMPLVFIPTVIFPFVFSKLVIFQMLIGLTFPAYLALAWMEPKARPPKAIMYYAIAAYFIALTLSVIFSVDASRSWWGNQERMNGLFTLLHFLAWLTMAVGLLKTWDGWKKLLNYEVVLSVFMACVALLQLAKKDLLLFEASGRPGGLLDNPIYMGSYQIFNLSFLALLFAKTKNNTLRMCYGVAAAINLSAFFVAQSRGALIGLAAVIAVCALYAAFFTKNQKARWGILAGAGAVFAGYAALFLMRGTAFIQSNVFLTRMTNFSFASETRFIAWDIAWKGFLERPLTGWGLDTFHILFNLKYNPRSLEFSYYETWFDRAHNTVMDVLSMSGLLGLLTFVGIFAALFYSVWRAHRRGWIDLPIAAILTALPVGYFLQNLFVFDHPAAFSMSYLLFAFVIVATRPGFLESAPPHVEGRTRPMPLVMFGVVQALFLLVVWQYSIQPFRASIATIEYNRLFTTQPTLAWEAIQRAAHIPTPYLDEQTFLLARNTAGLANSGQLTKYPNWQEWFAHAKTVNKKHLGEHPRNTQQLFAYARLLQDMAPILPPEEQTSTLAESEAVYRQAIETSPKRQQLYFALGQLYTMVGRHEEAYQTIKAALDYNRNIGEAWWYVGLLAWKELGRPDEGMDAVLSAIKAKTAYHPTRAVDGLHIAQAAAARGETEILQQLLAKLPSFSNGSVEIYLEIARAYEQAGLLDERNTLLNAIEMADPSVKPMLQALRDGTVQTINESMQMTTTSTGETAPVSGGSGPRR